MNFFSAIGTMWQVSREAEGALGAFQDTVARGGSVAEAVAAFAEKTDNKIDDALANDLVAGLNMGIDYLGMTSQMLADASMFVAKHGPELALNLTKLVMELQKLRG